MASKCNDFKFIKRNQQLGHTQGEIKMGIGNGLGTLNEIRTVGPYYNCIN